MKKSFFFLHIAIILAGITGIFGKLIALNEILITFYRMLFAALILLVISLFYRKKKAKYSFVEISKIGGTGLLLGLHWIFFYGSIKYANISVGVVCFCLAGFFTAILEPIINKKKASFLDIALSCLTVGGIALIFSFDTNFRTGIYLGIISSLLVALFTIFNEKLTQTYETVFLTKIEMIVGTIGIGVLLPFIAHFYKIEQWFPTLNDLLYLLFLSGICTVLLYILLNIALRNVSAFTVNLSFNLEPIYAIIIAVIFFNEYQDLKPNFFIGLSIILMSLGLQMIRTLKTKN